MNVPSEETSQHISISRVQIFARQVKNVTLDVNSNHNNFSPISSLKNSDEKRDNLMVKFFSCMIPGGAMSGSERDAGFCSGGDEDDMSGLHSPSASEDSVEVQISPISLRNKRKLAEPRKLQEPCTAPLKKRRRYEQMEDSGFTEPSTHDEESRPASSPSPFRPWSSTSSSKSVEHKPTKTDNKGCSPRDNEEEELYRRYEEKQRRHEARIQGEVLLRLQESNRRPVSPVHPPTHHLPRFEPPPVPVSMHLEPRQQEEPLSLVLRGELPRVPSHPAVSGSFERPSHVIEHMHQDHTPNEQPEISHELNNVSVPFM